MDKSKRQLILVTGASGNIGSYCVKQLLERGYDVRGTIRSTKDLPKYKYLTNLPKQVGQGKLTLVEGDLMKEEGWTDAANDILHVAFIFINFQRMRVTSLNHLSRVLNSFSTRLLPKESRK